MLTEGMTIGTGQYKLVHVITNSGYISERWCAVDLTTQDSVEVCVYPENMKGNILECFIKKLYGERESFVYLKNPIIQNVVVFVNDADCFFIISPYFKGSIYSLYISNGLCITEAQCWNLLKDVASALSFLHNLEPQFIYGNLSPRCILLKGNGKYAINMMDYYFVSIYPNDDIEKGYYSPEHKLEPYTEDPSDDIWSLGAIAYELITGIHLESFDEDAKELLREKCSKNLADVIEKCLSDDRKERYTSHELANISFFNAVDNDARTDYDSIAHSDTVCWNCGGKSSHKKHCYFVLNADENLHKLHYSVYIPKCDDCEKEIKQKKVWNFATGLCYFVVTTFVLFFLKSEWSSWGIVLTVLLNAGIATFLGCFGGGLVRQLLAKRSIRKIIRKDENHPFVQVAIESGFNRFYVEKRS